MNPHPLLRRLRALACVFVHGDHRPYWFAGGTPDLAAAKCRHCGAVYVIRFDERPYAGVAKKRKVA